MHPYGFDTEERRNVVVVLLILSIAVGYLVSRLVEADLDALWWIDYPSVVGAFGLLYASLNKRLWRMERLHAWGLLHTPDLNGAWCGTVTPDPGEHAGVAREIEVEIRQTWSHVCIELETGDSRSHSLAAVITTAHAKPEIFYQFVNDPKPVAVATMEVHRGSAQLRLSSDGATLDGHYYSAGVAVLRAGLNFGDPPPTSSREWPC